MDIFKVFETKPASRFYDLKVALICIICALLPYYTAVHTINYPQSNWIQKDLIFYQLLIIRAFGEEVVFRLIPLATAIHLFGVRWRVLIPLIALTSTYFSLLHNDAESLLALGPGSILLAIAFLYYGGLKRDYLRGLIWCGSIHIAISAVILILVPLVFL